MDVRGQKGGVLTTAGDDPVAIYRAEKAKRSGYMRVLVVRMPVNTRGDSKQTRLYCPQCKCIAITVARQHVVKDKRVKRRATCSDCLYTWLSSAQEALGVERSIDVQGGAPT